MPVATPSYLSIGFAVECAAIFRVFRLNEVVSLGRYSTIALISVLLETL